jgi:tetratricopeptide (TPR) repeat protein
MGSPANINQIVPAVSSARYRVILLIALTLIGLSLFDRFFASLESTEQAASAQRDYENGMRLLTAGKPVAAIDELRSAHSESRENLTYELALIRALGEAGRFSDANILLDEVRLRYPNDGNFNLTAARLAAKQGNEEAAEAYYHRAIFGQWSGNSSNDATVKRNAARMELIDYLAAKGRLQPLLAELISLEAETPADSATQPKLARLFLTSGAPARSATAWESYLAAHRDDAAGWAGLGEAQLQAGDYRRARSAFREALQLVPDNPDVKARYALLDLVTALDPTPHQLPAAEKHARAVRILNMANADLAQCSPSETLVDPAKMDAEQVLSAAEQTWQLRVKTCAGISSDEDALRLIMNKLTTQ